jgi:hypothetical protein
MEHVRLVAIATAATLPAWWGLVTTVPADAAPTVRITAVQYDSPGSDRGGNASLNAEWIRITNASGTNKVLTGWTLRDTARHVYRFRTFTLGSGKSVRVHTGSGANSATDLYWGMHWYVWNNDGDKAILKTASGTVVSVKSW